MPAMRGRRATGKRPERAASRTSTMNVADILGPEQVCFEPKATSKKHALEVLSEILARTADGPRAGAILESLVSRERLGSTALGDSVAMPHARIASIERSVGAFLRLGEGVDFDAPDNKPVTLIFGLLMPTNCSDDEIGQLRELIEHLRDPILQEQLRQSDSPPELYALLTDSLTAVYRRLNV